MTAKRNVLYQGLGSVHCNPHARPFSQGLAYGGSHASSARPLAAINPSPQRDVQIARYFGSEFLRPELEKARDRMVNLISLYLLETTGGDLHEAAISLRDHSFLSRSKGGSDMLKRLIALPESSNFGMAGYADAETPLLATVVAAQPCGLPRRAGPAHLDAQTIGAAMARGAVRLDRKARVSRRRCRSGDPHRLVMQVPGPNWQTWTSGPARCALRRSLPPCARRSSPPPRSCACRPACPPTCARWCRPNMPRCWPTCPSWSNPPRRCAACCGPPVLFERVLSAGRPLAAVDDYHRSLDDLDGDDEPPQPASKTWTKTVQGNDDEHSLLTLFLCLAAGVPKKTLLTEKTAASLVRKIRKSGWQPPLATGALETLAEAPQGLHPL